MKVVKNCCYGGYALSEEAYKYLDLPWDGYGYEFDNHRENPRLIEVVEVLGNKANGRSANLIVVEVPDDAEWYIDEYDGYETIREEHRIW
jgi:hypothetical protein